ncbi:UNVERIFIED_CONTAM: hypothetical protein HHA_220240 [Hammondia hammondi]|eukprot:XP_008887947.1 hypothetical protein HHA_220240 [Hammondia hammondi]
MLDLPRAPSPREVSSALADSDDGAPAAKSLSVTRLPVRPREAPCCLRSARIREWHIVMAVRHRSGQLFWVVGLLGFWIYVVSLHASPVHAVVVAESESEAGDAALVIHDAKLTSSGGTSRPKKLVKKVQEFLRRYALPIRVGLSAILVFLLGYYAFQNCLRRTPREGSRRESHPPDEDRHRGSSPETAPEGGTAEGESSASQSPAGFPRGPSPPSTGQADDGGVSSESRVAASSFLGTSSGLTLPSGGSDDASQAPGVQGLDLSGHLKKASKSPPSPASGGKPVEGPLHSTPATGGPSEAAPVPPDTQSPCCGAKGPLPQETSPTVGTGTHDPGTPSPPSPFSVPASRLASFFVGSEGGAQEDVIIFHSPGPWSSGSSGFGDSSLSPSDGDSATPSDPARGVQQEGTVGGSSSQGEAGRQAQAPSSVTTAPSLQTGISAGEETPTSGSHAKLQPERKAPEKIGGPSPGSGSSPGGRIPLRASKLSWEPPDSPTGGPRGRGGSPVASRDKLRTSSDPSTRPKLRSGSRVLPTVLRKPPGTGPSGARGRAQISGDMGTPQGEKSGGASGASRKTGQRPGGRGSPTKPTTPKPSWVPPYAALSAGRTGRRTPALPQSQEQPLQSPSGERTHDLDGGDQGDSR